MNNQEIEKNFKELSETYLSLGVANQELKSSIKRLDFIEKQLHQFAEDMCCVDMSEDTSKQRESECMEYLKEANQILPKLDNSIIFNTDPRGYALKVTEKSAENIQDIQKLSTDWGNNYLVSPKANI